MVVYEIVIMEYKINIEKDIIFIIDLKIYIVIGINKVKLIFVEFSFFGIKEVYYYNIFGVNLFFENENLLINIVIVIDNIEVMLLV